MRIGTKGKCGPAIGCLVGVGEGPGTDNVVGFTTIGITSSTAGVVDPGKCRGEGRKLTIIKARMGELKILDTRRRRRRRKIANEEYKGWRCRSLISVEQHNAPGQEASLL